VEKCRENSGHLLLIIRCPIPPYLSCLPNFLYILFPFRAWPPLFPSISCLHVLLSATTPAVRSEDRCNEVLVGIDTVFLFLGLGG